MWGFLHPCKHNDRSLRILVPYLSSLKAPQLKVVMKALSPRIIKSQRSKKTKIRNIFKRVNCRILFNDITTESRSMATCVAIFLLTIAASLALCWPIANSVRGDCEYSYLDTNTLKYEIVQSCKNIMATCTNIHQKIFPGKTVRYYFYCKNIISTDEDRERRSD